ncbi:Latrophilin-like protein LAT-2 [Labeo rohita]|uniref:Latrophilin-like protein LAT-2 n=1 Tax=Labeo rohita TaxID=84645 RepID=A0ABQ8N132_LABRO|nr:Latrophilin-like protein LAT-2 [Labeo rohita]
MVKDEHRDNLVLKHINTDVKPKKQEPVPVEIRRQGTEPSRRILMDLNTGMLKEELSEMNRRVSGYYNPPVYEMRKGTQNSHATLVDPRTGQLLEPQTEQQRSTAPLGEFRQGTEYQPYILQVLRLSAMYKQDTETSRKLLMDLNAGLLKEHRNQMHRKAGSKWEVVSDHEDERSQDSSEHEENNKAAPVEIRRQGTEFSRRILIDVETGMPKEELSEMNRRVSGYYNPPAYEMRKGTQNSHATLVDPRTGQLLGSQTEQQRSTAPLDEFRQGTEYQLYILQVLRLSAMHKPGTETSRKLLMDLDNGLLKKHQNKMDRRADSKWEVVSDHEDVRSQDSSENKDNHKAAPVEILDEFKQGTEYQLHTLQKHRMYGIMKQRLTHL